MQLIKMPLCMSVAGSAGFGYILHTPTLTSSLTVVTCGVLLLACGAAGGNSMQEAVVDGLLTRTRNRPMVTGRLTGRQAACLSTLLISLGLGALWQCAEGKIPLLLGITALLLYNGVYTPLKKNSVSAMIPGALAGALPPLIGWTAAGGMLSDHHAWLLFALFFLWQIPHFCLILLAHHEEYRAVEQPTLISFLSNQSLTRITFVWILAFIVVALCFPLDDQLLNTGSRLVLTLMAGILTIFVIPFFFIKRSQNYRFLFRILNGFFFATLLIVALLQLFAA